MRHRRWVIVLAVLIIAVLPLSFIGLRIASRSPSVKRAVLSRIVPRTEGRLSIGELEIGLASLRLGDVTVEIGEAAVVSVPEASVSVSYKRLLTSGFELRRSLSTVIVNDPSVTITLGAEAPPDDRPEAFALRELSELLPDYLGISGGTLVLEESGTGRSVRIDSIDLLVSKVDADRIEGSATGGGLGAARNVSGELEWDRTDGTAEITVELTRADFERGLALPEAMPFDVVSGVAEAAFAVSLSEAGVDSMVLAYSIDSGRVLLPGELGVLDHAAVTGRYDGRSAIFGLEEGRWHEASVRADGAIDLDDDSFRTFTFEARGVPLDRLAEVLGSSPVGVRGAADLDGVLDGPIEAPVISASAWAESVEIAGVTLRELFAEGAYTRGSIVLDEFRARVFGGSVAGSGATTIGRGDEPWALDLAFTAEGLAAAEIAERFGTPEARGRLGLTAAEVRGTTDRPEFDALLLWNDAAIGPAFLGTGAGGILVRDGTLYAAASSVDSSYVVTAEVSHVFTDPVVDAAVVLSDLAVDSLLAHPLGLPLPLRLDGEIGLAGPPAALVVSGTVAAASGASTATVALEGRLTGGSGGPALRLSVDSRDAAVRGVEVPFSATIEADRSTLAVSSLDVAGVASAEFRVWLGSARTLEGSLVVSEAELADVMRLATGSEPVGARGLVFASGSLTGTAARPRATLQLQVGSGVLAGVGGLDAALRAALDGRRIDVLELTVREAGRTFLTASGEIDLDGEIALFARGDGIPGPLLAGGEESGFDLTLGLGGRTDSPTLDARVESFDGVFFHIPYDRFVARITGAEGVVRVEPLALEKGGSYRLSGSARVPLEALSGDGAQDGSLSVGVDGDPLAFLAELTPLVERASGSGRLEFHLVGSRREVTLASAELSARASRVEPSVLFEELRDVEANVSISDGAVVRGSIRAVVDGSEIGLRSVPHAAPVESDLVPLTIGGVEVGILALSTGGDGVQAGLPGLMLPEDVGRVAVRGKGGAPEFLIAGPSDRPFLWGELQFSDMTFTYPFVEQEPAVMGGFLSEAEWSLRITAGRNLWYWRPDADLRVEAGGYLDFAGVPSEGGLCVSGRVESSKGSVTYLDTDFDAKEVFADFPQFCEPPRLYVEATTRVEDGTTITLKMDAFERPLTLAARGATIDESALTLSSDSPDDNTEEKILAKLSYGLSYDLLEGEEQETLGRRRAVEVIGTQIAGRVVRPLLSPIEGRLKRKLNLDLVRFEVDFIEHFLAQLDQWSAQEEGGEYQPFLANSRVTLGKYISRSWLLSYVGFAAVFEEEIGDRRLGIRHELGIEYEVSRNTSLSLRTVYDPSLAGWDRRISVENRFEF